MKKPAIGELRYFLKNKIWQTTDFRETDQNRGIPAPVMQKPYAPGAKLIDLVPFRKISQIKEISLNQAIRQRISHRSYIGEPLTIEELSYLLWATQGIRQKLSDTVALRTVPSAGARHSFESYLGVINVRGLDQAIYRYLPVEHKLLLHSRIPDLKNKIVEAVLGQKFVGEASVVFIWTAIPYRMEWRYGQAAHKAILLDAGHVCQNLYLAVEDIGAGTCAIAAYNQDSMDDLLDLNRNEEEFVIYLASVGKI